MRIFALMTVVLVACSVEFPPPLEGDTGSVGDSGRLDFELLDLEPQHTDSALLDRSVDVPDRPMSDVPVAPPLDAEVDVPVVDAALPPVIELHEVDSQVSCVPERTLRWHAEHVDRCELDSLALDTAYVIPEPAEGSLEIVAPEGRTIYRLRCWANGALVEAHVEVVVQLNLAGELRVEEEGVFELMRECVTAFDSDAVVAPLPVSGWTVIEINAARLCLCAGYTTSSADPEAIPDLEFMEWADVYYWDLITEAWREGKSRFYLRLLTCTDPVSNCADLLYPR